MENSDIDLVGQTVGNMFYKVGIVDKDGKLTNQFVAKASTNRVDIPESALGTGEGTAQSTVPQLPTFENIFSGSATGGILLSGVTPNYDNIQDGLLITLSNVSPIFSTGQLIKERLDLSSVGLNTTIKIPKEKLIVNSSFDISDQLSQYIGKKVYYQSYDEQNKRWLDEDNDANTPYYYSIVSFGGTTIKVLSNTILGMNLTINVKGSYVEGNASRSLPIPVIQVNTYKN